MKPIVVDPRDTKWESETADYRVFVDTEGTVAAYDLKAVTFEEVNSWAKTLPRASTRVSIAIKVPAEGGDIGLVWLTRSSRP